MAISNTCCWFHRLSHKFGFLWFSHVVHHSSNEFNLAVWLRQTWLPFVGMVFWLPLGLVGFKPEHILLMQAASLSYQFLMHTQLINLPKACGWVCNTPSHHRVHHGRNAEYIDKNFGGVLIVWDRLFRSFFPERVAVDYGIDEIPARGEVWFVQLWGPWQYVRSWFRKGELPLATSITPRSASLPFGLRFHSRWAAARIQCALSNARRY